MRRWGEESTVNAKGGKGIEGGKESLQIQVVDCRFLDSIHSLAFQ